MTTKNLIQWDLGNGLVAYISQIGLLALEEEMENESFGFDCPNDVVISIIQNVCIMFSDVYDANKNLWVFNY